MEGVSARRFWWLGVLGLMCLITSGEVHAWERPPVKVNTVFQFRVEVKFGPEIQRPTAPWYAYFPADPRSQMSPQTSPYPPWPTQFPPQGQPPGSTNEAPKQGRAPQTPPNSMLTQHRTGYSTYGTSIQPVGYVPTQVPSYWYQNR